MKKEQTNQIKLKSVEREITFNFIETRIYFEFNNFLGQYTIFEDVDTHSKSHIVRYFGYFFIDSTVFEKITVIQTTL